MVRSSFEENQIHDEWKINKKLIPNNYLVSK